MSAWVNSYLIKAGLDSIKTLPDDISDGVKIIQFLELITERPGCVGNYSKRVANRIQKMENNSKVIKFIKDDLGIKLVGIGAEGERPPLSHILLPICLLRGFAPLRVPRTVLSRKTKREQSKGEFDRIDETTGLMPFLFIFLDIVDGNLMLVLGLLWSCFRKLSLGTIADNIGSDDDDEGRAPLHPTSISCSLPGPSH